MIVMQISQYLFIIFAFAWKWKLAVGGFNKLCCIRMWNMQAWSPQQGSLSSWDVITIGATLREAGSCFRRKI